MKRLSGFMLVVLSILSIAAGCGRVDDPTAASSPDYAMMSARANGIDIPANAVSVDLIAGKTMDVGEVTCWIKGGELNILYSLEGGWTLGETQCTAAASIIDIDLTKNGTPKIGHFPWKREHEPPVDAYLYSIPLDDLDFDCSGEMVIAAHAHVVKSSGDEDLEEGAWAYGESFAGTAASYDDRIERPGRLKDEADSEIIEIEPALSGNWSMYFTVTGWQITVRELLINEIFYCGSDYSKFYFYDQFVELYNASEDTLYLDGCIITRNYPTILPDMEDVDYVRGVYAFQFPGTPVTGREHPIYPGQHLVVAADAIDHSLYASNSIDLSGADWEFFNPLGSDYDVPGVPNVVNIIPGRTADFMINLAHNAVVLATGEEYWLETYYTSSGAERLRIAVPLYTVLDGVEYSSAADFDKELTVRVDAGFTGLGNTKYSARSVERITPGLDSNDSASDFRLVGPPSPGYQSP